jgi:5'-nucleotidase / UDP-sugar diphosphatase
LLNYYIGLIYCSGAVPVKGILARMEPGMTTMGRIIILLLFCAPLALFGKEQKLTIIHTNDMHSHFLGFPPSIDYTPQVAGDDSTRGGWARIKTVVTKTKGDRANPVLVVDAGDFLMGTLFHMVSRERSMELRLLHDIGYDMVTLGNHEFDLKPAGLARILDTAKRGGFLPAIVSSNVIFSATDDRDNTLEDAFKSGLVLPYRVIVKDGIRIGLFGLIGTEAAEVAPFAKPVTFGDPVETAKKMTSLLRNNEKADLVICLSHSGLDLEHVSKSEDVKLARAVPDIDIIISGHTHTPLPKPIVEGKTIIVQAWCYGLWAGILDVAVRNGMPVLEHYRIQEIDDSLAGDPGLIAIINGFKQEINAAVLAPLGLAFESVLAHTNFDLTIEEKESSLGNIITDASRWYANRFASVPNDPLSRIEVAFDSNGLIRDSVVRGRTGNIAVCDLFNALPLGIGVDDTMGYPMLATYMYASELKKAFEILTSINPIKGYDYFLQVSGLKCTYNPRRMIFDRVTDIQIGSEEEGYRPLDYSESNKKLYRVTANIYNATFLKIVGNFTMGILTIVPKDRNGRPVEDLSTALIDADPNRPGMQEVKQWKGLLEYARSFKDINGDGIPDVPEKYKGTLRRIVAEPSLNPVSLLRRGTFMTWIGFGGIVVIGSLLALVGLVVYRRIRPGKKEQS